MSNKIQYGLLAVMIMAMVACGGGSGGGGKKSSSSSAQISSVASSEASSVMSSAASSVVSSVAESSTPVSSSSAISSVESSAPSSSSSSTSSAITTTFNVSIRPPELGEPVTRNWRQKIRNFFVSEAIADSEETVPLENLAVVVVDLAGNVIETIPLDETNSTLNPDGSWSIRVPGYPQLDCIVIANLNGPITLVNTDNIFDLYPNALFTPTTDEDIEVNLASTAAYKNLLDELGGEGTFESLGLDVNDPTQLAVLENLIATVAQVIENQIFLGANDIATALNQIQAQVVEIVKEEATNVKSATESTLKDAMQTGGGIHWYEGYEPQEIHHGAFIGEAEEAIYAFNGSEFVLAPQNQGSGDLILGANGWVAAADIYRVTAMNEDGSLTLSDIEASIDQINIKANQAFDLAGRNIANFFSTYTDTQAITGILNPGSTFAEGSIGYRANIVSISDKHSLWYEPGNNEGNCPWNKDGDQEPDPASDFGGNCETVAVWSFSEGQQFPQHNAAATSIAALKSADVAYNAAGSKLVAIGWPSNNTTIAVQLIDNAEKTAKYYLYTWENNQGTLIGQSTWSQITLPNLTGDAAVAISLNLPTTVEEEGDFSLDELHKLFALDHGFIRPGNFTEAGALSELGFLILNGTASDSIIAAANYKAPVVGSWLDEDTEGATPAVLTFVNNLQYTVTSFSEAECSNGLETGYYALKGNNLRANSDVNVDNDCGLSSLSSDNSVTVEGNTLTVTEGEDVFTFTRLEGEGVLGTWVGKEPADGDHELILSFLPENRFVFSQHGFTDMEHGNNGYEYGTYTLNGDTGAFVPSVSINKDGEWGFSHSEVTYTIAIEGNNMTITVLEGEEEIIVNLKRVTGPVN